MAVLVVLADHAILVVHPLRLALLATTSFPFIRTCCGTLAAMPWPMQATTPGHCRPGLAIATSSIPSATPNLRRIASGTSGVPNADEYCYTMDMRPLPAMPESLAVLLAGPADQNWTMGGRGRDLVRPPAGHPA